MDVLKTTSPCGDSSTGGELGRVPSVVWFPSGGGVARMRRGGLVSKTVANFALPYNKNLLARAKELRKARSLPEALLWREIKARRINGLDFDRQKIIGNYIVDFFCASAATVIEIDDKSHDMKENYDAKRDEFLLGLRLNVIHIFAKDVLKNPSAVAEWLKCYLLVE